jgi:hypothetical protein
MTDSAHKTGYGRRRALKLLGATTATCGFSALLGGAAQAKTTQAAAG